MNYKFDKENNQYEIEEYSQVKKDCERFIKENAHLDLVIQNDEDKKIVKKSRTEIRKKQNEIASLRKSLNDIVMGKFNEQAKEIESRLKQVDGDLKDKLDKYDNSLGKPKIIALTIKGYDLKKIEKVRAYAIKLGLEVK